MPITFDALLADARFGVANRRDIKRFYDDIKEAVANGELNLEGHSLPTTMNAWITLVEGEDGRIKGDYDVVSFSLADDKALETWSRRRLEAQTKSQETARSIYVSESSRELFERVKELEQSQRHSMEMTNAKKDDILGALSDLQAAVALFLQSYDRVRGPLRLPNRELALDKVRVRKPRAKS